MITRLSHISLLVENQDAAYDFYVNKLGFKVHTDAHFEGMRWLTITPPEQPNLEISLMLANTPAQKALVGKQAPEIPFLCFETNDCQKTFATLSEKGITFLQKPEQQPWGISALCVDLYGNALYIVQPMQGHQQSSCC